MADFFNDVMGIPKPRYPRGRYVPSKHDKFYGPNRWSGWVREINWDDRTIKVQYADDTWTTYEWGDVADTFSERYGGIWEPGF